MICLNIELLYYRKRISNRARFVVWQQRRIFRFPPPRRRNHLAGFVGSWTSQSTHRVPSLKIFQASSIFPKNELVMESPREPDLKNENDIEEPSPRFSEVFIVFDQFEVDERYTPFWKARGEKYFALLLSLMHSTVDFVQR